jgi:predicted DNA-binding helix-hairpin-helix protein
VVLYLYLRRDYIEFLLFFTKMDNAQVDPNMTMEDMLRALQLLQYENNNIRQAFEHLQVGASFAL